MSNTISTPSELFSLICNFYRVSTDAVKGRNRKQDMCIIRQVYCYIAFMNLGFSKSDTGIAMNQDHASVIHNIKKVKGLLEVNDTVITSALLSVRHALNLDAIESFQDAVKQNNFLLSENALLKEEVKLLKGKIEMVKEIIN